MASHSNQSSERLRDYLQCCTYVPAESYPAVANHDGLRGESGQVVAEVTRIMHKEVAEVRFIFQSPQRVILGGAI